MSGPENRFRTRFNKLLKAKCGASLYMQKHHGSEYSSGLPDMLYICGPYVLFAEVKAITGALDFTKHPTKLQRHTLKTIQTAMGTNHLMRAALLVWFEDTQMVFLGGIEDCERVSQVRAKLDPVGGGPGLATWNMLNETQAPFQMLFRMVHEFAGHSRNV